MILSAPSTVILHGQPVKRRAGFIVGNRLRCLAGGHDFNVRIGSEGIALLCRHRNHSGESRPGLVCGAVIYALSLPPIGKQPRMTWVTDVDANIVTAIRNMSVDEVLAYFGVSFKSLEKAG